jgi:hypothetical protein
LYSRTGLVLENLERYIGKSPREKRVIVGEILYEIKENKGRFIALNEKADTWRVVSDDDARIKIAHAIQYQIRRRTPKTKKGTSFDTEDQMSPELEPYVDKSVAHVVTPPKSCKTFKHGPEIHNDSDEAIVSGNGTLSHGYIHDGTCHGSNNTNSMWHGQHHVMVPFVQNQAPPSSLVQIQVPSSSNVQNQSGYPNHIYEGLRFASEHTREFFHLQQHLMFPHTPNASGWISNNVQMSMYESQTCTDTSFQYNYRGDPRFIATAFSGRSQNEIHNFHRGAYDAITNTSLLADYNSRNHLGIDPVGTLPDHMYQDQAHQQQAFIDGQQQHPFINGHENHFFMNGNSPCYGSISGIINEPIIPETLPLDERTLMDASGMSNLSNESWQWHSPFPH